MRVVSPDGTTRGGSMQWLHVLRYSCKMQRVSREAQHKLSQREVKSDIKGFLNFVCPGGSTLLHYMSRGFLQ